MIALLQEAEDSKAPITRLLERYAAAYLPIVLAIAGIVLFTTGEVDRAIAVLVVACPCALVLSGPVAMVAALAVASRWGILIKGSSFLERVSEVDTVVLDKTGTVVMGNHKVYRMSAASQEERDSWVSCLDYVIKKVRMDKYLKEKKDRHLSTCTNL